jgi:hypothetical protein
MDDLDETEAERDDCRCESPSTRTCPRSGCTDRICDSAVCARSHWRLHHASDDADYRGDQLRDQRKDEDR